MKQERDVIIVCGLRKQYGTVTAVDGIAFRVGAGEIQIGRVSCLLEIGLTKSVPPSAQGYCLGHCAS